MEKEGVQCAKCKILRCKTKEKTQKVPPSCPTEKYPDLVKDSIRKHRLPENHAVNLAWRKMMDKVMNPDKPQERYAWTRVDEIVEYAKIRGMKRLGIATCYALMFEAKLLSDILEKNGFDVISVSCLCGELNPGDAEITGGEIFCNPIMQAEVLNRENAELNIMLGLCLGHDILFLKYSNAETTPLVVKDRATGHNPAVALYLSQGYYGERFLK